MLEAKTTAFADNAASSKRSKPPQPPLNVPAGHFLFRLLCHSSRIGGVIGRSGSIIKQLQQDTAARIRVEEPPPGADEQVIAVIASSAVNKRITLKASNEEEEEDGWGVNDEEIEVSAAQEAVIRVFERVLDVAAEINGVSVATGAIVSCRLLTESYQAGSVIGKGGKVIEKIRKDTGCKIRVLSSEKSPSCAGTNDQIIEIEGDVLAVKKALVAVSRRLQDCPPVDRAKTSGNRPFEAIPLESLHDQPVDLPPQRSLVLPAMPASSSSYVAEGCPLLIEAERASIMESKIQQQEMVFRLLCSNDRVGGVIGKGGTIVKALQNESGASISVGPSVAECNERLITISAVEDPESRYSPAQNAVVLVFSRSIEAGLGKGPDSGSTKGSPISARLLVPSNQVGCLLGKGGAIISEMRKATGAGIYIFGNDQVPKCALENDEVVQITGEFVNVQDALYRVTGKLRDNLVASKMRNGAGTRSNSSVVSEISSCDVARAPSSLGLPTSLGVNYNLDRCATITQSMNHIGLSHKNDCSPLPGLWASQPTVAGSNPRSIVGVGGGLASVKGGLELGSGNRSAVVTNTTVEIVVPENLIGSVYGENGSNLTRLKQISQAKVIVHEPRPGTTDRIVVISGTPDETQVAQSLLHAFTLSGQS